MAGVLFFRTLSPNCNFYFVDNVDLLWYTQSTM